MARQNQLTRIDSGRAGVEDFGSSDSKDGEPGTEAMPSVERSIHTAGTEGPKRAEDTAGSLDSSRDIHMESLYMSVAEHK